MRVVVAGGHGKIALLLERLLTAPRRHRRGPDPQPAATPQDVRATGADTRSCATSRTAAVARRRVGARGRRRRGVRRRRRPGQRRGTQGHRRPRPRPPSSPTPPNAHRRATLRPDLLDGRGPPRPHPGTGTRSGPRTSPRRRAAEEDLRTRHLAWTIPAARQAHRDEPALGRVHLARLGTAGAPSRAPTSPSGHRRAPPPAPNAEGRVPGSSRIDTPVAEAIRAAAL